MDPRVRDHAEILVDHCTSVEPSDDVLVGEKAADGAKVQRWFDCHDCGYETPSRIVYGAER